MTNPDTSHQQPAGKVTQLTISTTPEGVSSMILHLAGKLAATQQALATLLERLGGEEIYWESTKQAIREAAEVAGGE